MGCGESKEAREARARDYAIKSQMEKDKEIDTNKVKLLLLGAGESGKSTIFKQMKVIYGTEHTELDKIQMIPTIYSNILQAMKVLCEQTSNLNLMDKVEAKKEFAMIKSAEENDLINVVLGDAIKALWADAGIQAVWERRNEFQIIESVKYYFDRIDVIKMQDYLPSKDDILYSRVRTSGIVTERYVIDNQEFEMYDVGGQRNERKKWIHCFDGVTAVIFVAALSEYDQNLFEDATANRMIEAIDLFADICNNSVFSNSAMILFLNKVDLFDEKIKKKNIKDFFPDFNGVAGDSKSGQDFFMKKFEAVNKNKARTIYSYPTCATDTKNVSRIFNTCKEIIINNNLQDSGFL